MGKTVAEAITDDLAAGESPARRPDHQIRGRLGVRLSGRRRR